MGPRSSGDVRSETQPRAKKCRMSPLFGSSELDLIDARGRRVTSFFRGCYFNAL